MATEYFGSTVGAGYTGSVTGTTPLNYYERYMKEAQDATIFRETLNNEEIARNGVVERQIRLFKKYIEEGREDEAMEAYHKLLEVMKNQETYANLDDDELSVVAETLITNYLSEQAGEEVDLAEYIQDNAASASQASWQRFFHFDSKVDKTTEEDLLNEICGMSEEKHVSGGQRFLQGVLAFLGFTNICAAGDAIVGRDHV